MEGLLPGPAAALLLPLQPGASGRRCHAEPVARAPLIHSAGLPRGGARRGGHAGVFGGRRGGRGGRALVRLRQGRHRGWAERGGGVVDVCGGGSQLWFPARAPAAPPAAHHLQARGARAACRRCRSAPALPLARSRSPQTRTLAGAEGVVFGPGADVSWIKKTKVVSLEIHVSHSGGGRSGSV